MKMTHLTLPAATETLRSLELGTAVTLTGRIYTAREGVYKRAVSEGIPLPASPQELGSVNFHCSPAATIEPDGTHKLGAVTATASFRFAQWLEGWFALSKCNIIIGKGGMTSA
ncbi:MAG: fumarate hydratase C-terminal domain-containing protein, partial [Pseudomonadota bacterium]